MKKYVKCLDNTNGYVSKLTIGKEYEYNEKDSKGSAGPYRQVYIMKDDEGQPNGGNASRFSEPYEKMDETTTHQEAIKFLNLKAGDLVKVLEKPEGSGKSGLRGWKNSWTADMDAAIGNMYEVTGNISDTGVQLDYTSAAGWKFRFPAYALEKCAEETVVKKKITSQATVFKEGDVVKVHKKFLCVHGLISWADGMDGTVGKTGKINDISPKGNIHVKFSDGKGWYYLPESLVKFDDVEETNRVIKKGDKVKILSKFSGISGIHWASEMDKTIGKIGTVLSFDKASSGTLYKVKFVKDDDYWYYPACVLLVVDGNPEVSNPLYPVPKKVKSKKVYFVGDVVRITKNQSNGHSRDTVCEIVSVYTSGKYLLKKISTVGLIPVGSTFTHTASEFTKCDRPTVYAKIDTSKPAKIVEIPTTKFQKGDRVKIVKNTSHGFSAGTICTVERWSQDDDRYVLKGDYHGRKISQTHKEIDLEFADAISPVKETTVKYVEVDYVNSIKSKKDSDTLKTIAMYTGHPIITAIQITQTVKDERFELNPYLLIG
jgi:hypothetical protein